MLTLIGKEKSQYKANLHCHSTCSDGKMTPKELKEAYRSRGYSILAITDHETPMDHTALSEKDFLMLTGYEVYIRCKGEKFDPYLPEVHFNLLAKDPHHVVYINQDLSYCRYLSREQIDALRCVGDDGKREYTPAYVNAFVKTAKENGYICTYNHPVWSFEDEKLVLSYEGFFSMEMCNYSSFVLNGQEYNGALYDALLRQGKRIFCHSADDNHNKFPFDDPQSDSFGGFAMIEAEELSYPAVIRALENGDFYSSMGPRIHSLTVEGNRARIVTDPVDKIRMFFGSKSPARVFAAKDGTVTEAEFEIPERAPYIRFSATDIYGKAADTRGYFRDEWEGK